MDNKNWKYFYSIISIFAFLIYYNMYQVQFVNGDEVSILSLDNKRPFGITFNPETGNVYVTHQSNNPHKVSVINITDYSTQSFTVGKNPQRPLFNNEDGKLYVPNYRGNSITVIDKFNNTNTIDVGKGPFEMVVNPTNKNLYVTNYFDNTVSVINSSNYEIIKNITVGKGPTGIDYNKEIGRAHV